MYAHNNTAQPIYGIVPHYVDLNHPLVAQGPSGYASPGTLFTDNIAIGIIWAVMVEKRDAVLQIDQVPGCQGLGTWMRNALIVNEQVLIEMSMAIFPYVTPDDQEAREGNSAPRLAGEMSCAYILEAALAQSAAQFQQLASYHPATMQQIRNLSNRTRHFLESVALQQQYNTPHGQVPATNTAPRGRGNAFGYGNAPARDDDIVPVAGMESGQPVSGPLFQPAGAVKNQCTVDGPSRGGGFGSRIYRAPEPDVVPVATTRASVAPAAPAEAPVRSVAVPQAVEVADAALGEDPEFNRMIEAMDNAMHHKQVGHAAHMATIGQPEISPEMDWSKDTFMPEEDADDFFSVPDIQTMTATELIAFGHRVAANGSLGGYERYDRNVHLDARYPEEAPFPRIYDPKVQVKEIFVKSNVIIEIIKLIEPKPGESTDMQFEDHVNDRPDTTTPGKQVNILDVLAGIAPRINIKANREPSAGTAESEAEQAIATADVEAFPSTPVTVTTDAELQARIAVNSAVGKVTIQGYHDTQITPFYLTEEEIVEVRKYRAAVNAAPTLSGLVQILRTALGTLPPLVAENINNVMTEHFNEFLVHKLGIEDYCENMFGDYDEIVGIVNKIFGSTSGPELLNRAVRPLRRLALRLLRDGADFSAYLPMLKDNIDSIYVTAINTTTLRVPFSSADAVGILPMEGIVGVTREDVPRLFRLFDNLTTSSKEAFGSEADRVQMVTTDGKVYYIHRGVFGDNSTYVISSSRFHGAE